MALSKARQTAHLAQDFASDSAAGKDTLAIQAGVPGAKVNAMSIDGDGNVTFLHPPVGVGFSPSTQRLNTANGYGATNTKIRRFTNNAQSVGTDVTYADSATLGASFTVVATGVYDISYSDQFNQVAAFGITKNTADGTSALLLRPASEILAIGYTSGVNAPQCCSVCAYLTAGDVIRAHTDGSPAGTNTVGTQFTMTRVA